MVDLKTKALRVIELLVSSEKKLDENQTQMIFLIAHAALGECPNTHDDIIQQIEQTFNENFGTGDGYVN